MRNISLVLFASLLVWSCTSDVKPSFDNCQDHAVHVFSMEEAFVASNYNPELASGLMRTYAEFANSCSSDSLAPEFLMRRADMLRGEGNIHESIAAFTAIHDGYPQFPNKILCALISGYMYETQLNDKDMAEKIYMQIVESYPESKEAKTAEIALLYLRETPEELNKRLKLNQSK